MLSDLKLDKRLIARNLKEKTLNQDELDQHLTSLDDIQDKGIYFSDLFQQREEEEARLAAEEEARLVAEEEARLAEEALNQSEEDEEQDIPLDSSVDPV